jgi:hypothetical protein
MSALRPKADIRTEPRREYSNVATTLRRKLDAKHQWRETFELD